MAVAGVEGWEVVFTGERLQADLLAAVLDANGITAEVFGDTAYSYAMNFTDARVMVPADQADSARRVIRQAQAELSTPPEV
jgi:aspartokinase